MKKLFTALICATMFIGLGACSSKGKAGDDNPKPEEKKLVEDKKTIEIVDSGYYVTQGDEPYIEYGIIIKNPNDNYGIEYPSFTITMYDKEGKILGNDEQVLMYIGPGETLAYGGQANPNGKKPDKVEFKMKKDENKYSEATKQGSSFKIINTNDMKDEYGGLACTGEIENISDTDYDSVAISLLLYKGDKIVYGTTTYVDTVNAKSKTPFEVSSLGSEVPEYDKYKIYAQQW